MFCACVFVLSLQVVDEGIHGRLEPAVKIHTWHSSEFRRHIVPAQVSDDHRYAPGPGRVSIQPPRSESANCPARRPTPDGTPCRLQIAAVLPNRRLAEGLSHPATQPHPVGSKRTSRIQQNNNPCVSS